MQNRAKIRLVLWIASFVMAFTTIILLSTRIMPSYSASVIRGDTIPTSFTITDPILTAPSATQATQETVVPSPIINPTNITVVPNPSLTKPPILLAQPQPLNSANLILARLRPSNGKALIEQVISLEPVQAGRIQPLDYLPAKNGQAERLLVVLNKADEAFFVNSGIEYNRLDEDADTARYYAISLPETPPPSGENWIDQAYAKPIEQIGNRVIVKAELPYYIGFGANSKLQIEKLPPRIYLPNLTAPCPCPVLAAATFAASPVPKNDGNKELKEVLMEIKEDNLERLVSQIAQNEVRGKGVLNTRYAGSVGSVYMAERLYNYFFALGLSVEYDSFLEGAFGTISSNVIAEQFGQDKDLSNEPVLLIAHYDSLGERDLKGFSSSKIPAYGANDNGVGIAGLIEIARLTVPYKLKRPIRYIAFGSEEQGMLGSQHYANYHVKPGQPTAIINLDSFGYNPGKEDWVVLAYDHNGSQLKDALVSYVTKYAINLRLEVRRGEPFFRSDDYYFSELGYSAVALTDSFNLQSPNNHTANDTLANVNFVTSRKVIQLTLVSVAELADK